MGKFVEHKPCAVCGEPRTSIMIGPPATTDPHWLCFNCFMQTPAGVQLVQGQIKQQLGETEE